MSQLTNGSSLADSKVVRFATSFIISSFLFGQVCNVVFVSFRAIPSAAGSEVVRLVLISGLSTQQNFPDTCELRYKFEAVLTGNTSQVEDRSGIV